MPLRLTGFDLVGGSPGLFAGASGAGKSTLALGCLQRGWDLLSDDIVFLGGEPGAVLGFPEPIDVTEETRALLPELQGLELGQLAGAAKRPISPEAVGSATDTAVVAAVVPHVHAGGERSITPVTAAAALRELAPTILMTEPASTQQHLDALSLLVRSYPVTASPSVQTPLTLPT